MTTLFNCPLVFILSLLMFPSALTNNFSQEEPLFLDVEEDLSSFSQGRRLADSQFSNLRITPLYDRLQDNNAPDFVAYMKNNLAPPVISFFQAALKVKYPVIGNLKLSTSTKTICGGATPQVLYTGIATDYVIFYDTTTDDEGSWVADSYACSLASGTKRPLIAKTLINLALFGPANENVLLHEKNTYLLLHEMTHTFGFSSSLYPYFLDENGVRRTGHIKNGTLDGASCVIINVPPLTERLRTFFGCSSLEGAYMENSGSDATAGGHFERRQFAFEAMTSGLIYQQSYSQFTLAMLEGSGWYVPDYSMVDPYWFGQGQGCAFLNQSCTSTGFDFDEFCTGSSRGCTVVGRGGGSCSSDTRSNDCRFVHPNVNYDCENYNASSNARFPTLETYGRGNGSKCFTGTLSSKSSTTTMTSFCFKPTCQGTGLNTTLTIQVGTQNVTCKAEGAIKVSGYYGNINCPDPLTFCSTVGKVSCPRGCMGRGTCVNGKCQCFVGFSGNDCGLLPN